MPSSRKKNPRSIFATILAPMVLLLLAEAAIFLGSLSVSGAMGQLEQSNRDILAQQVISRADSFENYLVGTVGNLNGLADQINESTQRLIDEGQLDIASISSDAKESTQLQLDIVGPLVSTLREERVSGVFVIFNTQSLEAACESGSYGRLPGLYVRDMDPAATPSARNEDLVIECSASEVVQKTQITTDTDWRTSYDFDAYGARSDAYTFLYQTFQVPFADEQIGPATDYAYWGAAQHFCTASADTVITYSIPLILEDGTVYGIVGADLAPSYLRSLLPYQELLNDSSSMFIVTRLEAEGDDSDGVDADPVAISGHEATSDDVVVRENLALSPLGANAYEYHANGQTYYLSGKPLRLYNTNSPVEDAQWALLGMVPAGVISQQAGNLRLMIALASALMLLLGGIGIYLVSRSVSDPVKALSEEVSVAQNEMHVSAIPELSATGITEVDQLTDAITSLSRDIASVKALEQQRMEYERDYDLLTGLMNRRAFYRETNELFSDPQRLGKAAIVMIDIDNLKDINDKYGHDWGDKYVHAAARSFEVGAPDNALIGRVSGDEFYLLLFGYQSKAELEAAVEKLKSTVQSTGFMFPDGRRDHISVSGGAAVYVKDSEEFAELMRLADFTMYQVKDAGKNDIVFFDEQAYERQSVVQQATSDLRTLLADYSLASYHFQPIFDAASGRPFAYEALLRVSMEALKSPQDVLVFARREKRLEDVERLTWMRTLESYRNLLDSGQVNGDAYLFVNTFPNLTLPRDEMARLAQDNKDLMSKVVIEITEAENMDAEAILAKREIPHFSGEFALDDYGSGYNSEIMLLELKPTYIKVDTSIIRDIDASVDKQRIVSQVVDYAHERGMIIVAEGIETAAELSCVLDLGVDLLQGFFLARPNDVPEHINPEALELIRNR